MTSDGTLNLDARQRAMLDEMGVRVWWPVAAPAALAAAPPVAREVPDAAREAAPEAAVAGLAVSAPPDMPRAAADPTRRFAVPAAPPPAPVGASPGAAAVLIDAPQRIDGGAGAASGGWLIVADMPPELDGRHRAPLEGDAGRLLAGMLRALGLQGGAMPVHLMRTHRGVASGQPGSPRPMVEAFAEPVAALAPRLVLAMGPLAAQSLLQSREPLGRLRGRVVALALAPGAAEVPLVVTYHPAYLLRNPADKARAWADLCLAAEQ